MNENNDDHDTDGCAPGVDTELWLYVARLCVLAACVAVGTAAITCIGMDG